MTNFPFFLGYLTYFYSENEILSHYHEKIHLKFRYSFIKHFYSTDKNTLNILEDEGFTRILDNIMKSRLERKQIFV